MAKRTLAIDFDGVMNLYTGWKGEDELYQPRSGLADFLNTLRRDEWTIIIYSTRDPEKIKEWLKAHKYEFLIDGISNKKPMATCYLDDRAVNFNGDWTDALAKLVNFKTHWE